MSCLKGWLNPILRRLEPPPPGPPTPKSVHPYFHFSRRIRGVGWNVIKSQFFFHKNYFKMPNFSNNQNNFFFKPILRWAEMIGGVGWNVIKSHFFFHKNYFKMPNFSINQNNFFLKPILRWAKQPTPPIISAQKCAPIFSLFSTNQTILSTFFLSFFRFLKSSESSRKTKIFFFPSKSEKYF